MSCCAPGACAPPTKKKKGEEEGEFKTYEVVKDYYGKVLSTSKDLKTSACTAGGRPPAWLRRAIAEVPPIVSSKFYGCGAPLPAGIHGLRVLDLGSGSGRDCYVLSKLVGEHGRVIGVDMTEEQLEVAREHISAYSTEMLGYAKPNCEFVKGYIECLDKCNVEDRSVDMIVSNCVVNLSPDKRAVLKEAYRVLENGGEMYFSDVYCDRRLPKEVVEHEVLFGECLSGALYIEDFQRLCHEIGFTDPRVLAAGKIEVHDEGLSQILGEAKFYSITYRLFKLEGLLETKCEDYGQYAIYKGTIPGSESGYALDDHHYFVTGKPLLVCGNTAAMVGEGGHSWLAKHFSVVGNRAVHYGLFEGCEVKTQTTVGDSAPSMGGCC